jgi:hypothetical protein
METMRFSGQLRVCTFGALVMLLLFGMVSASRPMVSRAASLTIPRFYTISRTSYDKWVAAHKNLPTPLKAFAADTTDVGYIVGYSGATPKVSTFHAVMYDGSGEVFLTGRVRTLTYKSGYFTNYFDYFPRFPGGAYKMKLFVDGKLAGSTSFSVAL